MLNIIVANICDTVDTVLYGLSPNCKNKKNIILVQTIGVLFGILASILVNSPIGVALASVNIVRNSMVYFNKMNKVTMSIVVLLKILAAIFCFSNGIWGLLVAVTSVYYTIMSFVSKDKKQLCMAMGLHSITYIPYQFSLSLVVGGVLSILTTINAFINYRKECKNVKESNLSTLSEV